MTRLAFDIYPPPVTGLGSRLVRLTNQHYAGGTTYIHGRPMGQGTIVVEKGNSWVTATNFAVGNYVIVRDLDISEVSDSLNVLGGFFLEEGDFLLVSDDPKVLTFSGRSTIVILERAILGPEALSEFAGPNDIIDGYWRWGSDTYGGVMRRGIYEANLQTPAGLPMIDTNLIGSDSVKWDDAIDSNGVAWPSFAGDYRTQCGTTLLELYRELYGFGVELEIDARTFDIHAYNPDGYGTDRTSATFATGKVRFVAGVNIAADLSRQIRGTLRRTHLLVRTTDWPQGGWIESDDYTPGDPIYKGVYQTGDISGDPSASAVIDSRAQRNMDLRTLSEDAVRIPLHEPGDDEANGRYTPGPNYTPGPTATTGHFWTGDLITLDTGDHTMDYQDASKRVEAVEYVLREAGDWQAIVHLGPRAWLSNSSIPPLAGAGSHTLPIELCDPTIVGSTPAVVSSGSGNTGDPHDFAVEVGAGQSILVFYSGRSRSLSGATWKPTIDIGDNQALTKIGEATAGGFGAENFEMWYLENATPSASGTITVDPDTSDRELYAYAILDTQSTPTVTTNSGTGASASVTAAPGASDLVIAMHSGWGALTNAATAGLDQTEVEEIAFAAIAGAEGVMLVSTGTGLSSMTAELSASGDWGAIAAVFAGSGADSNPYAGVSPKAARCDHDHPPTEHEHNQYADADHSHALTSLDDVDVDPLSDGDVLVYDSTTETWVASAPGSGSGIPPTIFDAEGDLIIASAADTAARLARGTDGYHLVSTASTVAWEAQYADIVAVIDGGGSAISTGIAGDVGPIDFPGVIESVTVLADQSGNIVVDIWNDTYANFPPTDADSITAAAPPTLSGVAKNQDTTLTGWDTAIVAGDILRYNVDSAGTVERVTLTLKVRKT